MQIKTSFSGMSDIFFTMLFISWTYVAKTAVLEWRSPTRVHTYVIRRAGGRVGSVVAPVAKYLGYGA